MGERRPLIAMVVNNAVAHDARVLKTAMTMARAGANVRVLGVSASGVRERAVSGSATFERLPVLPARSVTLDYARWAGVRRFGRAFPADRWTRSVPVTGYYRRAFLPALEALAPDAVHVHDVHLLGTVAGYAAAAARRPKIVYDAHEYVAGLAVSGARTQRSVDGWAALEREFVRSADRVITVSEGLAGRLQTLHRLKRQPVVVHNAPVAWEQHLEASRSLRAECGLTPDTKLAVYSGALSAARGVGTLVEALGLLPDLHLAVVAVPYPHPMAAALREVAARVGASDRLHMVPPVPSHEVPSYLSEADLGVSPIVGDSVSYDEALPNKLFEFLHAGLPMVVSDCRAMASFVTKHGLGRVFRAGDPGQLAEVARAVLADPPNPDTVALRRQFSWQGQEPNLMALYDDLVSGLHDPKPSMKPSDLLLSWSRAPTGT